MVQLLESLKVECKLWKICYDIFKTYGRDFKPDYTQNNVVFIPIFIQALHGNRPAYMPAVVNQCRSDEFLFRLSPGEYTFNVTDEKKG